MDDKEVLDIKDIVEEFINLDSDLKILSNRFKALAMDYREHIDNSFKNDTIYNLRDRINYRLSSSIFHLKLLLNQIDKIQDDPEKSIGNPFGHNPIFIKIMNEISSIYDSFIFHTTSVFDYVGTLLNYISGEKKEDTMQWKSLAKSVRCKNNSFSDKLFARTIDAVDREFVGKLYDYRSLTIHRKPDYIKSGVSIKFGQESGLKLKIIAGDYIVKGFKELKKKNKEFEMTLSYVSLWIINKTIDKVTEILFSIKKEIESKSKNYPPFIFKVDQNTNEIVRLSSEFWHEDLYQTKK